MLLLVKECYIPHSSFLDVSYTGTREGGGVQFVKNAATLVPLLISDLLDLGWALRIGVRLCGDETGERGKGVKLDVCAHVFFSLII